MADLINLKRLIPKLKQLDDRGFLPPKVIILDRTSTRSSVQNLEIHAFLDFAAQLGEKHINLTGTDWPELFESLADQLFKLRTPTLWNTFIKRGGILAAAQGTGSYYAYVDCEPNHDATRPDPETAHIKRFLDLEDTPNYDDDITLLHELGHFVDDKIGYGEIEAARAAATYRDLPRNVPSGFHSSTPLFQILFELDDYVYKDAGIGSIIKNTTRQIGYDDEYEKIAEERFAVASEYYFDSGFDWPPCSAALRAYFDEIVSLDIEIQATYTTEREIQEARDILQNAISQSLESLFGKDYTLIQTALERKSRYDLISEQEAEDLNRAFTTRIQSLSDSVRAKINLPKNASTEPALSEHSINPDVEPT